MKKTAAYLFAILLVVLAPLWAQNNQSIVTGPQNVTGVAQQQFGATFGNGNVGSMASGASQGFFNGNGSKSVFGVASAQGGGTGNQYSGPNWAASNASSVVSSNAYVNGDLGNQAAVSGAAAQTNWANTGGGNNYANGFNQTIGGYNGAINGNGPLSAQGTGSSNGATTGSFSQTANSAQAQISTIGTSSASMNVPGNTFASGNGAVSAGSMVGNPNINGSSYAGGAVNGTATYNGVGNQYANGSLVITGQTNGVVLPNFVGASAVVKASANGSNGGH